MAHLEEVGLREDIAEAWKSYTDALKDNNVKIGEEDDHQLWSLNPIGTYVPKLGYRALVEEGLEGQVVWWWKIIWKLRFPSKNKFHVVGFK
jgi:hypothetical protein